MPISGDDYDMIHSSSQQYQIQPGMSKAEQRKSNKPIMEKRRRARINHCLNELKSLILDALKKDPARHSKLEKADILEMTVKHLQTIQQQQLTIAMATDPTVIQKFKTGFNECATEVSKYIGRMDGIEACVKQRLVSHLASCVSGLKKMPTLSAPTSSNQSLFKSFTNATAQQSTIPSEDVNNNHASARLQMMTGVQLIPSRLPTGELALLLPNPQQIPGNMISFFPPQETNLVTTTSEAQINTLTGKSIDRHHFSAFTAVNRDKHLLRSPLHSPSSSTPSTYCDDSTDQPYPSPNNFQEVSSTSEQDKIKPEIYDGSTSLQVKPIENLLQLSTDYQNEPRKVLFPERSPAQNLHTPLTVITSDNVIKPSLSKFKDVRFQHPANINKNPLDFSVKKEYAASLLSGVKRPYTEDNSSNLLMKSDSPLKVMKFSFDEDKTLDLRNDPNLGESSRPSTSSSDATRDMWRPW